MLFVVLVSRGDTQCCNKHGSVKDQEIIISFVLAAASTALGAMAEKKKEEDKGDARGAKLIFCNLCDCHIREHYLHILH